MSYVKLFGGPWDGRIENVVDGCDGLWMNPRTAEGPRIYHQYRRSPEDPTRFVYEGTNE